MCSTLLLSMITTLFAPSETPDDPYREALAAAVHNFVEHDQPRHLQTMLDKHPELLECRRPQVGGKPSPGDYYTPLQTAAAHGRTYNLELLLKRDANVHAVVDRGRTSLHLAAEGGHLEAVKALVRAGAKVNVKSDDIPRGVAPNGHPKNPPLAYPPRPGETPLELAKKFHRAEVVKYLESLKDRP